MMYCFRTRACASALAANPSSYYGTPFATISFRGWPAVLQQETHGLGYEQQSLSLSPEGYLIQSVFHHHVCILLDTCSEHDLRSDSSATIKYSGLNDCTCLQTPTYRLSPSSSMAACDLDVSFSSQNSYCGLGLSCAPGPAEKRQRRMSSSSRMYVDEANPKIPRATGSQSASYSKKPVRT